MSYSGDRNPAEISAGRKTIYYIGNAVMIIGFILFFSFFFSIAMTAMNSDRGFDHHFGQRAGWAALRLFTGFILIVVGSGMRGVGGLGLAGSGVVLDPAQARRDVQPWSRMAGGVVNDAVSEIGVLKEAVENPGNGQAVREVIKVRCRNCKALNDETAKFCDQCGQAMQ